MFRVWRVQTLFESVPWLVLRSLCILCFLSSVWLFLHVCPALSIFPNDCLLSSSFFHFLIEWTSTFAWHQLWPFHFWYFLFYAVSLFLSLLLFPFLSLSLSSVDLALKFVWSSARSCDQKLENGLKNLLSSRLGVGINVGVGVGIFFVSELIRFRFRLRKLRSAGFLHQLKMDDLNDDLCLQPFWLSCC